MADQPATSIDERVQEYLKMLSQEERAFVLRGVPDPNALKLDKIQATVEALRANGAPVVSKEANREWMGGTRYVTTSGDSAAIDDVTVSVNNKRISQKRSAGEQITTTGITADGLKITAEKYQYGKDAPRMSFKVRDQDGNLVAVKDNKLLSQIDEAAKEAIKDGRFTVQEAGNIKEFVKQLRDGGPEQTPASALAPANTQLGK